MICTKCSNPLRPIVSVDIDGTLGNYHGHFTRFASAYLNRELPKFWDGYGEFEDFLGISKPVYREIKLAYRQGAQKRTMPIFQGAAEFVNELGKNFEVWITTTRPWQRLDGVDPDTKDWLTRHNIRFDYLLYDERKYRRMAEIVDPGMVVAIVDDLPEFYDEASLVFGLKVPILAKRLHNKSNRGMRVSRHTWSDIEKLIYRRHDDWKQAHYG